jgi:hypothetical protein
VRGRAAEMVRRDFDKAAAAHAAFDQARKLVTRPAAVPEAGLILCQSWPR